MYDLDGNFLLDFPKCNYKDGRLHGPSEIIVMLPCECLTDVAVLVTFPKNIFHSNSEFQEFNLWVETEKDEFPNFDRNLFSKVGGFKVDINGDFNKKFQFGIKGTYALDNFVDGLVVIKVRRSRSFLFPPPPHVLPMHVGLLNLEFFNNFYNFFISIFQ